MPRLAKYMPDYAGLRYYAKARTTGTHVGIYDGEEAGMDTDGGRWQTVCEEHGSVISPRDAGAGAGARAAPGGVVRVLQRLPA